jgi:hypothetical protein
MSWTVACFCGSTFTTPPMRCRTCGRRVPGGPIRTPIVPSPDWRYQ